MTVLLIVDIQYDFLPGGALAVSGGDEIIPILNSLSPHFPLVVATQDWHPVNHGSFASVHPGRKPFDVGELRGKEQVFWPDHCVQGHRGADFSDSLDAKPIEAIFRKGTDPTIDSYSGFYDNARLKSTGLAHYLKGRGVSHVYIGGLAADYCVSFSALDALEEGFKVTVIEDATRAIDNMGWEKMKKKIIRKGGKIIHSSEL